MARWNLGLWVLGAGLAAGCGSGEVKCDSPPAETRYDAHVQPMLEAKCTNCHASDLSGSDRKGAPADVNLDTYENARAASSRAADATQQGKMPPAQSGETLTDDERCILRYWVDKGTPR